MTEYFQICHITKLLKQGRDIFLYLVIGVRPAGHLIVQYLARMLSVILAAKQSWPSG